MYAMDMDAYLHAGKRHVDFDSLIMKHLSSIH